MTTYPHLDGTPEGEPEWFDALLRLARYLRTPEGCPWDREQGALAFARFAREESAELIEAIASGDLSHTEEEFGDVFFVLLATAAAAEEQGGFNLERALRSAHEKMIRRHEHVFGEHKARTPEEAVEMWNAMKAREKGAGGGAKD